MDEILFLLLKIIFALIGGWCILIAGLMMSSIYMASCTFADRLRYTHNKSLPWRIYCSKFLISDWMMWSKGYYKDIPSILQSPKYNATRFLLWPNSETMRVEFYAVILAIERYYLKPHHIWEKPLPSPSEFNLQNLNIGEVILVKFYSSSENFARFIEIGIRKTHNDRIEVFDHQNLYKICSYNLSSDTYPLKKFISVSLKHANPQIKEICVSSQSNETLERLSRFVRKYSANLSKLDRFLYYNPFISRLLDALPSITQSIVEVPLAIIWQAFFFFFPRKEYHYLIIHEIIDNHIKASCKGHCPKRFGELIKELEAQEKDPQHFLRIESIMKEISWFDAPSRIKLTIANPTLSQSKSSINQECQVYQIDLDKIIKYINQANIQKIIKDIQNWGYPMAIWNICRNIQSPHNIDHSHYAPSPSTRTEAKQRGA